MKIGWPKLAWPSHGFLLVVGLLLGITIDHLIFGFNFTQRHLDYVQKVTEKAAAKRLDEAVEINDALWKRRLLDSKTLEFNEGSGTYRRPEKCQIPKERPKRFYLWS